MAASIQDKRRRVIPQWRTAATSIQLRELDSLLPADPGRPVDLTAVHERIEEWNLHPSPAFAAEVMATATVAGVPAEATDAARFITSQREQIPRPVRWLAEQILAGNPGSDDEPASANRIRYLRRLVRDDPRNALRWAEIAREYATIGKLEKALSSMTIATELTPENRYILRSAARLFVHAGRPDRAHDILFRSEQLETDPWIMAAEIAVSSVLERTSENIKFARRLLDSSRFGPFQITELASAVATVEIGSGNIKQAKRHLREALVDPNSNSVGQVRWAQTIVGLDIDESILGVERAYEARAWHNYYAANWQRALSESQEWQKDEPYSSRPPILGSYIAASLLQDYPRAIDIARRGLSANASNSMLLNNLIYSLICEGQVLEAKEHFARLNAMEAIPIEAITRTATRGLLDFRLGLPESGRRYYQEAMEAARLDGDSRSLALAAAHLAIEEDRIKSPYAEQARLRALELGRKIPNSDLALILQRL